MYAVNFQQANKTYGPPEGMTHHQVRPIRAFDGTIERGSLEGSQIVVCAWKPTVEELGALCYGDPIFIAFVGGLPPHLLTTDFEVARNPS